jgi:hypothetical protein
VGHPIHLKELRLRRYILKYVRVNFSGSSIGCSDIFILDWMINLFIHVIVLITDLGYAELIRQCSGISISLLWIWWSFSGFKGKFNAWYRKDCLEQCVLNTCLLRSISRNLKLLPIFSSFSLLSAPSDF